MIEIKLTDLERRMLMVFCETEINKMILTKEIEYDEKNNNHTSKYYV